MDPRFTLSNDSIACLYRGHITTPSIYLRPDPKPNASIDTELLFGQGFDVHAELGTALYGRVRPLIKGSRRRGYVGYIPRKAFSSEPLNSTHVVTALAAPIFKRANIKSGVKLTLPMNAKIVAIDEDGDMSKIPEIGYIHNRHIRSMNSEAAKDFVEVALQFIGQPYVWGGTGAIGLDCSGLVQMSLAACDIDSPRDADQQEKRLGQGVDLASLKRGDLIFWPGHVGIMETKTRLLHANAHHMMTAQEPLKKAIQRIGPPRTIKRL